jgi:hypothetical protein
MCNISNKIKLCSCTNRSVNKLDHYWILHRFNEAKDIIIIGEPIMPYEMPNPNYGINAATLTTRLNDNDAFDIAIKFEEKDQLEIVFNQLAKDPSKTLIYYFKYTNGKWFEEDTDPFDLMNHYDEFKFGKLKDITPI